MNILPNALVIGPMKSGTSWIHDYLESRGDIGLPRGAKETFFFDRRYTQGNAWYERHFKGLDAESVSLVLEVAPSYFHCKQAPGRVHEALGDIPLVVTLRDPVKRAWSHYLHLRRYGHTTAPLREAVQAFPEILEASRYATCMKRWEAVFGTDRLHVLWLEDLAQSYDEYASQLCKDLGISFVAPSDAVREKQNEMAVPSSASLARLGSWVTNVLKSNQLYGVVNLAKTVGLKELFYGKPGARTLPKLSQEDADWLASELAGEVPEWAASQRFCN